MKKINKRRKKEISGLTTYRHTFPPSTTGIRRWRIFFTLRLRHALRPGPIWAFCRLDLIPCSPFSVSPFRSCASLGPPCPARPALARSLGKAEKWGFPLSQPHKSLRHGHPVSDDLLSGRSLSRVLVSQVPTKSDTTFVLETSLVFLAPGATSAVQF